MISEENFMKLPKCDLCKNKGRYQVRCNTEEQQDEYGVPAGEIVEVKCARCRLHTRRREMFVENKSFDKRLKFYELSDYRSTSGESYNKTKAALDFVDGWIEDPRELIEWGGFAYVVGKSSAGKSTVAHIIARECYKAGYLCDLVSIADLSVDLSHDIEGTICRDHKGRVVFDLEHYTTIDLLIVDDFHLVNDYFLKSNIRRALILKIFRDRLREGKSTVVLSKDLIRDMFSGPKQEQHGVPYDFPTVLQKNYKVLNLYGNFKN